MQTLSLNKAMGRLAIVALAWMLCLSLSRLALLALFPERVEVTGGIAFILIQGMRFDLLLTALLTGPAWLALPWSYQQHAPAFVARWLIPVWVGITSGLVFFVEAASAPFIRQFDARPNYLFVEYLAFPGEVLSTLSGTHLVELVLTSIFALIFGTWAFRWLRRQPSQPARVQFRTALILTPVISVALLAMVRSTLDHRPLNPSNAAFSNDALVNQLPLNSPYSVLYAVYERRRGNAAARINYGNMEWERALRIVRREARIDGQASLDPTIPTLHQHRATRQVDSQPNLVIILLESIGAEYVGELGGENLTPNLDALAEQGLWFDELYATGIRSARGIEAVITGFTPTPLPSVVKQGTTQEDFFTIAELLRRRGYDTSFIYGGESHFDNMRRFFLNNGFETVIDENDYVDPVYTGAWGVSDEDLFTRAHAEFLEKGDAPFFSLVFTSSNHEPFDIPAGRVESSPLGARETTISYTDYALGEYLDKARQAPYWDNTIFMVIADHNARIYGSNLVPADRFRIPGVIFGPDIKPRRIPGITSQIDMVPTLLSLMGISAEVPTIGRDITRRAYREGAGRAMMQFHANQGWLEKDWLVVLRHGKPISGFKRLADGSFERNPDSKGDLRLRALAHARWGPGTIERRAYRLPAEQ